MGKPLHLLFVLVVSVALLSCATTTSVRFDVEHPPLVDLRGLNRISIIPFERGLPRDFEYLSAHATSALTNGIRNNMSRGNLTLVNPQTLAHIPQHNFRQHVDVFIAGRITKIQSSYTRRPNTRIIMGQTRSVTTVTLTVIVDIEYSYIRASDGSILGTFRKREWFGETADFANRVPGGNRYGWDHGTWHHPDWNRPGPWDQPGWFDPVRDMDRNRRGHTGVVFPRRDSWEERVATAAISRFSLGMNQELAPWVTREKRTLLGRTGNNPDMDEAERLVRMGIYDLALGIYREIYERYGNISAGFNAAILLAATGDPVEALRLLEEMRRGFVVSNQSTPRFLLQEIERMAGFVYGLEILKGYRQQGVSGVPGRLNVAAVARVAPAGTREVSGTVNLNLAKIYALNEAIAYAEDDSIWSKIVVSTDADSLYGRWSMRLPDTAPPLLWFVVVDGRYNLYITQTALSTSEPVVLNTAQMVRLE